MNTKKCFVAVIVPSTVLLALVASFCHPLALRAERSGDHQRPSGKFGPVIEKVLPASKTDRPEILDLETGRALVQPPLEYFNSRADKIMAWIRSKGLDISCVSWSGGAACVTYNMSIVAVEPKCWDQSTEEELLSRPALAAGRHSPRRMLVIGQNRPETYIFRTGEGSLGMLQIVGLSQKDCRVKIRYKLIKSGKSV